MPKVRIWALAGLAAAALSAAGCGDTKHAAGCGPLSGGSTAARVSGHPIETLFLTDVQSKRDRCVDRISFFFRAGSIERPGFRVEYRPAREAQTEDGSGRRIRVAGSAFLVVHLSPAATAETNADQLKFTYKGPNRLHSGGLRYVREVVKTGDFEGVVTWAIGLSERRPFRVSASTRPGLAVEIG